MKGLGDFSVLPWVGGGGRGTEEDFSVGLPLGR